MPSTSSFLTAETNDMQNDEHELYQRFEKRNDDPIIATSANQLTFITRKMNARSTQTQKGEIIYVILSFKLFSCDLKHVSRSPNLGQACEAHRRLYFIIVKQG